MVAPPILTREYAIPPVDGANIVQNAACANGDWLYCIVVTSDSLHRMGAPQGVPVDGWVLRQIGEPTNFGCGYLWTARAVADWSGQVTIPITRLGNAGARQAMFWLWGFDGRSSGFGASSIGWGSGAPALNLAGCRANSHGLVGMVDWNAGAFNATWSERLPAGNVAAVVKAYGAHTAAANWLYERYPDMGAAGDKVVGVTSPSNWAVTILGIEVWGDWTAPNTPGTPTLTRTDVSTIRIDWAAVGDNSGVANYNLMRNGVLYKTGLGLTYTDTGLAKNTQYSYQVQSVDTSGNVSAWSAASAMTTPADALYLGSARVNNLYPGTDTKAARAAYLGTQLLWP